MMVLRLEDSLVGSTTVEGGMLEGAELDVEGDDVGCDGNAGVVGGTTFSRVGKKDVEGYAV
eukprot:scaffold8177_cov106-Cylindrotheca_fusiformis.AAC.6